MPTSIAPPVIKTFPLSNKVIVFPAVGIIKLFAAVHFPVAGSYISQEDIEL